VQITKEENICYDQSLCRTTNGNTEKLPNEHFGWFVALRETMADAIGARWRSCTVVFNSDGHYQFDFSYEPPPRLNGVYNDITMLKTFNPTVFLKRRSIT
jgi:hypothetical protein